MKGRILSLGIRVVVFACILTVAACAQKPPKPPPKTTAAPPAPSAAAESPSPRAQSTNEAGLTLIKQAEGLRLDPYQYVGGWFVGYGHALGAKRGSPITEAEADRLLRSDLAVCETAIRGAVTVPVSGNEFGAMASLCLSIGAKAFADSSVVKRLNAQDRKGAADSFLLWVKGTVNGKRVVLHLLEARRQKEKALFLTP